MDITSIDAILSRLLLAALLSGVIGWEREVHGRAAGLRTTILVGMGSCLVMMTSMHLFDVYRGVATLDPGRLAAQVVSGIGFLGAGTIMRHGASIRGLTTAAGLWAVAGVGLAVGCGYDMAALAATIIMVVVLVSLSRLERRMKKVNELLVSLEVTGGIESLASCTRMFESRRVETNQMRVSALAQPGTFRCEMKVVLPPGFPPAELTQGLITIAGVKTVQWQ